MAYTLKTTGVAAKLIAAIGVDDDGTTVKDFVTGNTGTYHASIAAPRIGTATWKGVTRSHFKTDIGADQFAPRGWLWSGTPPTPPLGNLGNGVSFLALVNAFADVGVGNVFWTVDANNNGVRIGAGAKIEAWLGAGSRGLSTTTLATATKLSFGFKQIYNGTALPFYYGLESGALAEDGTYNEGGFSSQGPFQEFGGKAGFESAPGQYFLALWFSAAALPTTAELQALHLDPWGTLFDVPGAAFAVNGGIVATLTPNGSIAVTIGTRFVSQALVTRNGIGLVNLSGLNWYWTDTFGGAVVASGAVETTDGSGVIVVAIPGTSLSAGQFGYLVLEAATGERRIYRLPVQ